MLVHGLDAHGIKIHGSIARGGAIGGCGGHRAVGFQRVGGAGLGHGAVGGAGFVEQIVVVILGTGHIGGDQAGRGGCIGRGEHILQRIHEVLCGDRAQYLTVAVHPVLIPQVEGPGQGIRIPLPGGGQTLADLAAVVVLHQRVHALGAVVQVRVCGADQIVQGGGLTGVQQGVGAAAGAAGGAAGSGRAAAAAQQAGCRCGNNSGTADFQELAAGNGMTHKKSLFLSDSGLDRMKLPRRHKPKKEATESIRYLFVTAYSYQRVTNASITLNPRGVNRFWAQRRQFPHRQQRQPHR